MRSTTYRAAGSLALCLVLTALLPAATWAGSKVTSAHLRGPLINALFTAVDTSGCVETDTFVTANQPTEHLSSDSTTSVVAGVNIFIYDYCTDAVLLQAYGEDDTVPASAFHVSNQLDVASLRTTMPMTNIDTGDAFSVQVNVSLSGTSDIHRDHSNTNDLYGGGCHVLNRWNGSGRIARASGSVTDGTTEFTPTATDQAEIGFVHDGFVVIGCA
jgi:hypothetical protein